MSAGRVKWLILVVALGISSAGLWVSVVWPYTSEPFNYEAAVADSVLSPEEKPETPIPAVVTHIATPEPVRAIYMSSWVAGTPNFRNRLVKIAEGTEINAIVIDVKDYTGKIAFAVSDPGLVRIGSSENRIPDVREFIRELHSKNIYVIARIAVFQDPFFTVLKPELAVKRASDGAVWQDFKGAKWLDSTSSAAWEYTVAIAQEAAAVGFDELNFDYIRFPSDGNMGDIAYPFYDSVKETKAQAMTRFFAYLDSQLADLGLPLSVDLFGMTTTNPDDLNIGQLLENALVHFDYISPMVYPSHYPVGFMGFKNPAAMPYEVVNHSMREAVRRAVAAGQKASQMRPWLQDFDLGANYDAEMIRKQKQAVYDAGLTGWMLWAPSNQYTVGALDAI